MNITRLKSRIDAVTVYREGALIRRSAEISATESGYPGEVCITGLPLSMSDASVRVRVQSQPGDGESADVAGELPLASDVRVMLDVPELDDDKPPAVADELRAAKRELHRVSGRISQVKRELARVERLVIRARPTRKDSGETPTPPPISPTSARIALLKLREQHERRLRVELAQFERDLHDAELQMKQLEIAQRRASSARQVKEHELRKALVISLHQSADGACVSDAGLIVEYLVPGARWAPAYTVRMAADGQASFAMRAVVAQKSGEDWTSVDLTLSTADAHTWTELPEMTSIRIGRRQPASSKAGWRPPPTGVEQLYSDYDRTFRSGGGKSSRPRRNDLQWEDHTRELTVPGTQRMDTADEFAYDGRVVTVSHSLLAEDSDELTEPAMRPPPAPSMEMMPSPSMPPPGAMPMESGAALPPMRSRSAAPKRDMKKKAKGAPAMSMPSPQAAPGSMLFGGMAGGGGGSYQSQAYGRGGVGGRQEPDIELTASADLLAYANLRMPSPRVAKRGSLRKADPRDVYMEMLVTRRLQVSFSVTTAVTNAGMRASAVAEQPLPARHRLAGNDRYDYAYRADTPVDVPSDGAFHSLALIARPAETSMKYVVVPRESTDVFRMAEMLNPLGAPILDGPVDVYMGKDFLLTSDAPFTPPGGSISLGLGAEQSIKVTRNTSYSEETSGLLRGSLMLMHDIRVEVQNHLPHSIECEVRERIPSVRKDEDDIDLKVESAIPMWHAYQPELASSPEANLKGGYVWRANVDGKGGKTTLTAQYSVKIPAKYELVGGNRREA